ncbi:MAG: hypothetical protein WBE05_17010, partial [Pseudolabrys sp.]
VIVENHHILRDKAIKGDVAPADMYSSKVPAKLERLLQWHSFFLMRLAKRPGAGDLAPSAL